MNKKKYPGGIVGVSLLTVVLLVLCLVVFSVLFLVSAERDNRLSAVMAENTTQYYNACSEAALFHRLADELAGQGTLAELDNALRTHAWALTSFKNGKLNAEKSFTISEDRHLIVHLQFQPDSDGGFRSIITRWQTENTSVWSGDDRLNVFGSDKISESMG